MSVQLIQIPSALGSYPTPGGCEFSEKAVAPDWATNNSPLLTVLGDMHLENCRDFPRIVPTAKYLFLAGDIGHISNPVWRSFIEYINGLEPGWHRIFYVLGNHEYYSNSKTMPVLKKAYQEYLDRYSRIKLLDRNVVYLPEDGCVVLGATMWSQAEFSLVQQINDFRRINLKSDPLNPESRTITITPMAMNELHVADKEWLFEALSECAIRDDTVDTVVRTQSPATNKVGHAPPVLDVTPILNRALLGSLERSSILPTGMDLEFSVNGISTIIILTHFPLVRDGTSHPSYSGQKQAIKNYYANDYHQELVLSKKEKQIISISGHTHFKYDFELDGIRYINAGACGYHLP